MLPRYVSGLLLPIHRSAVTYPAQSVSFSRPTCAPPTPYQVPEKSKYLHDTDACDESPRAMTAHAETVSVCMLRTMVMGKTMWRHIRRDMRPSQVDAVSCSLRATSCIYCKRLVAQQTLTGDRQQRREVPLVRRLGAPTVYDMPLEFMQVFAFLLVCSMSM